MSEWDRLHSVEERLGRVEGDIKVMSQRLTPVEEGVANFRQFQVRGNRYFDRAEAVLDENERRRQDGRFWITVVALFLVPFFGWLAYQCYTFTEDVIQMDHQWRVSQHAPQKSWFNPQSSSPSSQDVQVPRTP